MKFKTAYGKKSRVTQDCGTISKTKQSFKDECDINNILKKYQKSSILEHVNTHQGDYSDLGDLPSYQESLNIIINAKNSFNTLPSSIRKQFENDPAQFLDFVSNPENKSAMAEMGLLKPEKPENFSPAPPVENISEAPQADPDPIS